MTEKQYEASLVFSEIMYGNTVGISKRWQSKDGVCHKCYQINDRGRGDSLVTTYKTDEKGLPIELNIRCIGILSGQQVSGEC